MGTDMLDLEKELRCWICIDVLYQPLTVLDCLHTFCGSCLKEWFSSQGRHSSSRWPYTCPTCRASVRDTRQNATVKTLVELFTQANPGRGKTEEEKAEMRKFYKQGDNILPTLPQQESLDAQESEADRRLLEEVRELSLQDGGSRHRGSHEPRELRSRRRTRDAEGGPGRHRRFQDAAIPQPQSTFLNYRPSIRRAEGSPHGEAPARHVEHQTSLRSLISASDMDSQEVEEEIMRQIMEEGLLDGLDLDNIDATQEDEISERIAQAYRTRRRERLRQAHGRPPENTSQPSEQLNNNNQPTTRSHHSRSQTEEAEPATISYPPVSRPHLFDATAVRERRHGRSSSHGRRSSDIGGGPPSSVSYEASRPAARSATDLSQRPGTSADTHGRRRGFSQQDRRNTDTQLQRPGDVRSNASGEPSPYASSNHTRASVSDVHDTGANRTQSALPSSRRPANDHNTGNESASGPLRTTRQDTPSLSSPPEAAGNAETPTTSPLPLPPVAGESRRVPFLEPSISCDRCHKTNIEYDLHYNCSKCHSGKFYLCLRCYRQGKGCNHWYGFGKTAWRRYEREKPAGGDLANFPLPHTLVGHRYIRPSLPLPGTAPLEGGAANTEGGLETQLQAGLFCDICFSFANETCWRCDSCNDGEWGFCNACVNQGCCCTHPLLPIVHKSISAAPPSFGKPASAPSNTGLEGNAYRPLNFNTACDICKYPVPPSHTRFHCPQCNNGDYDFCTSCYLQLVNSGRIIQENGHQGWRRCPRGHRMVVVGFEDREGGQTRVVVKDIVGGHALKEDPNSLPAATTSGAVSPTMSSWRWRNEDGSLQKRERQPLNMAAQQQPRMPQQQIPPSGGIGMRVLALWSYWPEEGATDELAFPRGAEIREVENINGDWFWGVYAGDTGVFPSNHGRVVG